MKTFTQWLTEQDNDFALQVAQNVQKASAQKLGATGNADQPVDAAKVVQHAAMKAVTPKNAADAIKTTAAAQPNMMKKKMKKK